MHKVQMVLLGVFFGGVLLGGIGALSLIHI